MDFEVSLHKFHSLHIVAFPVGHPGVLLVNGQLHGNGSSTVVQHPHGFGPRTLGELSIHPCVAMVSYGAGAFDRFIVQASSRFGRAGGASRLACRVSLTVSVNAFERCGKGLRVHIVYPARAKRHRTLNRASPRQP